MSTDLRSLFSRTSGYTLAMCLLSLELAGVGPARGAGPSTPAAGTLVLNTTLRTYGPAENVSNLFRIELPETGILTLDVSAPGVSPTAPRLLLRDHDGVCRVVHERPRSLVLDVAGPGTCFLAVLAEDPRRRLAGYKLRNAFVAERPTPDEVRRPLADPPELCGAGFEPLAEQAFADDVFTRTCDEVDEVDCDGFGSPVAAPGVLVAGTADAALHAALFESPACDPTSLVAQDVLTAGSRLVVPVHPGDYRLEIAAYASFRGHYTLDVKFFDVCQPGESDDHGDTPLCATRLEVGEPAGGVVANAFGDDEDYFTFVLDALASVVIKARGNGVGATLYDEAGHLLASPGGPRPRIAQALGPGRYYARITALRHGLRADRPVAYELEVTAFE